MAGVMMRRVMMGVGVVTAALVAAVAGGCMGGGYSTWPPVEPVRADGGGEVGEYSAVNNQPQFTIVGDALRWVSLVYPPVVGRAEAGRVRVPFAVNIPRGVTEENYRLIARQIGQDCSPLSKQFTPEMAVYHIARVDVRGGYAEVIVLRPVLGLGADRASAGGTDVGERLYQPVRLEMRGGFSAWTVISHSVYPVGMMPVPPLNYVEDARMLGRVQPAAPEGGAGETVPTSGD